MASKLAGARAAGYWSGSDVAGFDARAPSRVHAPDLRPGKGLKRPIADDTPDVKMDEDVDTEVLS